MERIKISLAAARVNANMTQKEVSRIIHTSNKTLANWETGKSKPSFSSLNMLSQLYKIPVDNIFIP